MFCFIKPIKEKLQISWTAFPLKQRYTESWAMEESASSWLNKWLVIKGVFTNSHGPARCSNPAAWRRFYISNRSFSIFIHMEYIVTYLTAAGRVPLIDEVKAQGAPQQTTRTLAGCTHHSYGARLINRCIVW